MSGANTKADNPSPLSTLIRPWHVLQLSSLPALRKIEYYEKVTQLWKTVHTRSQDTASYQKAFKKLYNVSSIIQAAIKESATKITAIQTAAARNLDLSVGPRVCSLCLNAFRIVMPEVEIQTSLSGFPVVLPCGHLCCFGCVRVWFQSQSKCPAHNCNGDFEDLAVRGIDAQVYRYDVELEEVLDLMC